MKQIWRETETNGLNLVPATNVTWTPTLQGRDDMPIMELIQTIYPKKQAIALNRCHLYFQVITIYDLISYDGKHIHPNYFHHKRPQSRRSNYYWVEFKKTPERDLQVWNEFLTTFVSPIIANHIIKCDTASIPHYNTTYYRSPNNTNLYTKSNDSLITHTPREYKRLQGVRRYNIQGMIVTPSTEIITNLIPVDVAHYKTYIQYLCDSSINTHGETESPPNIKSLSHMYNRLPTSL